MDLGIGRPTRKKARTKPSEVSPEKITGTGSSQLPDDPLVQLSETRSKVGDGLMQLAGSTDAANYDIGQNMREIRAVLATNSEIFDRCMQYKKGLGGKGCNSNENDDSQKTGKGGGSTTFVRYDFSDIIRAVSKTADKCSSPSDNFKGIQFVASLDRTEKEFNTTVLSEVPDYLDDITAPIYMDEPFSMFIDYEVLFERALLLHDKVLKPFLAELKETLFSVQICLGKIEAWLIEPRRQGATNIIKKTFGERVEVPVGIVGEQGCKCPKGVHADTDKCLDCGRMHRVHLYKQGKMLCSRRKSSNCFQCTGSKVIKIYDDVPGIRIHDATFDIAEENGQRRLKKFVEFLAMSV